MILIVWCRVQTKQVIILSKYLPSSITPAPQDKIIIIVTKSVIINIFIIIVNHVNVHYRLKNPTPTIFCVQTIQSKRVDIQSQSLAALATV